MEYSAISKNLTRALSKEEKKAGNPLANLIYKLNLDKNSVTLILDANANEEEENAYANFDPVVKVDVDLHISA
jgi:hypothetical protein